MKATRAILVGTAVIASTAAFALPTFTKVFTSTYPAPKDSALAKANCAACHIGMSPKLNAYGKDQAAALKAKKTKTLTPAILKSLDKLDSDKDGVKNGVELKKGTLPGDPKSK